MARPQMSRHEPRHPKLVLVVVAHGHDAGEPGGCAEVCVEIDLLLRTFRARRRLRPPRPCGAHAQATAALPVLDRPLDVRYPAVGAHLPVLVLGHGERLAHAFAHGEPLVLEGFGSCDPILRIQDQQLLQQILRLAGRQVQVRIIEDPLHDLVDLVCLVGLPEQLDLHILHWGVPGDQHEEDHASRPHVRGSQVWDRALVRHELRRHEHRRAADRAVPALLRARGESEVQQHQGGVLGAPSEAVVGQLDVAVEEMHNVMQMGQRCQDLLHDAPQEDLRDREQLLHVLQQLRTIQLLHDHVKVRWPLKQVQVLHDVRARVLLRHSGQVLSQLVLDEVRAVCLPSGRLLDGLHDALRARIYVLGLPDHAKRARAHRHVEHLVLVLHGRSLL
mmetsp:Transcript_27747/g.92218  ORF Transcript_27747/g.92218 Transcript_27747/m.92218 type:complete len:389 (+) Transcript_27747:125-1291(+)